MRPSFITEQDISRWSTNINNDPMVSEIASSAIIKELCYATYWLWEELINQDCTPEIATRIQFTAGQMSFGKDPWEVCQDLLKKYKNDELTYEDSEEEIYN